VSQSVLSLNRGAIDRPCKQVRETTNRERYVAINKVTSFFRFQFPKFLLSAAMDNASSLLPSRFERRLVLRFVPCRRDLGVDGLLRIGHRGKISATANNLPGDTGQLTQAPLASARSTETIRSCGERGLFTSLLHPAQTNAVLQSVNANAPEDQTVTAWKCACTINSAARQKPAARA